METGLTNQLWITICGVLVLLMQAGFLCLEAGLTRTKNSTNVAMKNVADFVVAISMFWLVGFGLMFGPGESGILGTGYFAADLGSDDPWQASFFLFQAMFCATAVTIVSGAVAERVRFNGYLLVSVLIAALIYPVAGHWSWASLLTESEGWLESMGFVDFAGSTVVHSTGGWVALAMVLFIGPRAGRFANGQVVQINPSNPTLILLGVLLFIVGWIGFNGGSTLALNERVPGIITNTLIAATAGAATGYLLKTVFDRYFQMDTLSASCNSLLAGLVAVTANCHVITTTEAAVIGAVGAVVMLAVDNWMLSRQVDDAVGAVPVHLGAGIWGTLAVALFGDPELLGTGLGFWQQFGVQAVGIAATGVWAFGLAFIFINLFNRQKPLRVSPEEEQIGLSVTEHGVRNDLVNLLEAMQSQKDSVQSIREVPVEPFTEVGQIAQQYNQVMRALERAIQQTQAIVRDIRDAIITFDPGGKITSFNPGAEKMFDVTAEAALGNQISNFFAEDHPPIYGRNRSTQKPPGLTDLYSLNNTHELQGRRQGARNDPFHIELTISESILKTGNQYTALIRDVDEKKRMERKLFMERERALVTLGSIADGVITTDTDGRVIYLNEMGEKMTGWSRQDAIGQLFPKVYALAKPSGHDGPSLVTKVLRGHTVIYDNTANTLRTRSGMEYAVNHTAAPIKDEQGHIFGVVVVFHDITKTQEMQRRLIHQAKHDALTGLPNRTSFEERAGELIVDAISNEQTHILGYMDLDQFKLVNDTCGHGAGDELLRQVSALVKSHLRKEDFVARLGGDEFGILLNCCSEENGIKVAENIRQAIADFRFPWGGRVFAVGSSIGLVSIESSTRDLPELLSIADSACYMAKDAGRNRVHVYQPDDADLARHRGQVQWVARIRNALDKDLFRLYYQPIMSLSEKQSTRQYIHYEIFIRMIDDDGGIIPPGAFIPAAERYNLINEMDLWVVKNTLSWLGDHLRDQPGSIDLCGINLSGASVGDKATLNTIKAYIERYRVPASVLCFEITETAAISNLKEAQYFISELKSLGCRFALDDFGSGLSSFAYLSELAVDYLKIDGAFVKDIAQDNIHRVMVQCIHTIGHEMGLQTIAEFVESQQVIDHLAEIGVDYLQGYFIGEPQPLESIEGVYCMPR